MAYDPYGYQDPYGGNDPYGGYDAYGQYQGFEESPPPEPSKDWDDVPKINRLYGRKIKELVVQEEFAHLKNKNLYVIEAIVEYIKLNEELTVKKESIEQANDEIVTTIKVLSLPPSELSIARDFKKLEAGTAGQSWISLTKKSKQLTKFFQRTLPFIAKLADKSVRDSEYNRGEQELKDRRGTDEVDNNITVTVNDEPEAQAIQDTPKRPTIDVMEGKSVMLLMSGISMIQDLQTKEVKIAVKRINVRETEEGLTSDTVELGNAAIRLPQNFHEAVLRQAATKGSYDITLEGVIGEELLEVGVVGLTVTLVSLGQGMEVSMSNSPRVYGKVKLIEAFPPEPKEHVTDPKVHPRLAVTLMNMEPPQDLNKTSTEIIQRCLDSKLVTFEEDESEMSLKYKPKPCRWLEIAREMTRNSVKFSLTSENSDTSTRVRIGSKPSSSLELIGLEQTMDPELDLLWIEHKRQCRALWKNSDVIEDKKKALYEELEELLRQDKGSGWGSEVSSEKSVTSKKEDNNSKPSISSSKKSTLKSTK